MYLVCKKISCYVTYFTEFPKAYLRIIVRTFYTKLLEIGMTIQKSIRRRHLIDLLLTNGHRGVNCHK